jgi:ribosomal protein L11 methylase PrmA
VKQRGPFDLIAANILAEPLCAMATDSRRHPAPFYAVPCCGLHGCAVRAWFPVA